MASKFPRFRGANLAAVRSRNQEVIVSGPADCGKTFALMCKVHWSCLKVMDNQVLLVREFREDLLDTVVPSLQEVIGSCPTVARWPDTVREYGGTKPYLWRYWNGAEVRLRGMNDSRRGQALGAQYDLIVVTQTEGLTEAAWNTLLSRASGRAAHASYPQLIGDANPSGPRHWILRRQSLQDTHFVATHRDNPRIYNEHGELTEGGVVRMAALERLTGLTRKRLKDGQWVAEEGVIYGDDFDEAVHVLEQLPYLGPERWVVIDFGFTNPASIQWYGMDHDGRIFLTRQIYQTGLTATDMANLILQHSAPAGELIVAIVCDHDAGDRATIERELETTTIAANKRSVSGGINLVKDRLRVQPDGQPRVFFWKYSLVAPDGKLRDGGKPFDLLTEFPEYVWDKGRDDETKDAPAKKNDHAMDGLRYIVSFLDGEDDTPKSVTVNVDGRWHGR